MNKNYSRTSWENEVSVHFEVMLFDRNFQFYPYIIQLKAIGIMTRNQLIVYLQRI